MFLSGAVAGIAGMVQATGANKTLAAGVAGGVGFTAIIVAWLAQLNPWGILLVSSLFGILEKGSSVVESTYQLSKDSSDILQGILLFFVLGAEFFISVTGLSGGSAPSRRREGMRDGNVDPLFSQGVQLRYADPLRYAGRDRQ